MGSAVQTRTARPARIVVTTTFHDSDQVILRCRASLDDPYVFVYERVASTGTKQSFTNGEPRFVFVFAFVKTAKHRLKRQWSSSRRVAKLAAAG
jgi:hypothetical protein